MQHPLASLATRYRFNESLLSTITEGFSPEDWAAAPESGGNNPIWILGHITASRRFLLRRLGVEVEDEAWERHFAMGTQLQDPGAYPSPATLVGHFRSAGEALVERCATLDAEQARAPWGSAFPDGSETLDGGAHFLYMHETYHLGQIGLLRRIRSKPGFA
ncbi:MAG: DinB family protein [Planctomycetota bacterium]|nr:DinB family protein [Planctomycetota bacterium]